MLLTGGLVLGTATAEDTNPSGGCFGHAISDVAKNSPGGTVGTVVRGQARSGTRAEAVHQYTPGGSLCP